eukprot:SAG11_NODE_39_length_21630_cov_11.188658_1_plen_61_part_00
MALFLLPICTSIQQGTWLGGAQVVLFFIIETRGPSGFFEMKMGLVGGGARFLYIYVRPGV